MDYQWGNTYRKSRRKCISMTGREILEKKVGENVKMLHAGMFLRNKNENQYSGFS